MKLWAISDLHLACRENRRAMRDLGTYPDDGLILGGDVGETEEQLRFALDICSRRFRKIFWVPGNHDLWTVPMNSLRGEAKYRRLVDICRSFGALTPEDPYALWPQPGPNGELYRIAPIFTLYDYSFAPEPLDPTAAVDWAAEQNVRCTDEDLLFPDPFPSRQAWCAQRLRYTERRLADVALAGELPILVSHFPLTRDFRLPDRISRFVIWCGTRRTKDWHRRFNAAAVIYGHLHMRGHRRRDGVDFYEVSLGYPQHWRQDLGIETYLRQILPPIV